MEQTHPSMEPWSRPGADAVLPAASQPCPHRSWFPSLPAHGWYFVSVVTHWKTRRSLYSNREQVWGYQPHCLPLPISA